MRVLLGILALLVAGGCASKPAPPPPSAVNPPAAPPAAVAAPTPPTSSAPFSDKELADALVRQGVGSSSGTPTTAPADDLPTEIRQTPRGVVVTFRSVFFAFDSADLNARARLEVERMATVLNHPQAVTRRVVLEGYTDSIGSDAYNLDLSRRRAEAVSHELVARGVRRDRLGVEGYGKQRPVAPNALPDGRDNPAGRALNRRVEAVVMSQDGVAR
jgi:outer membrane protein OmpA-like peptidoglycan-associated protein